MNRFKNILKYRCSFLCKERSDILKVFSHFKDYDKEIKKHFNLLKGTYSFDKYVLINPRLGKIENTANDFDDYKTNLLNIFSKEKYIHCYIEELRKNTSISPYLHVISNLCVNISSETEKLFLIKYIKILYDLACTRKKITKLKKCSDYSWNTNSQKFISPEINININNEIINKLSVLCENL